MDEDFVLAGEGEGVDVNQLVFDYDQLVSITPTSAYSERELLLRSGIECDQISKFELVVKVGNFHFWRAQCIPEGWFFLSDLVTLNSNPPTNGYIYRESANRMNKTAWPLIVPPQNLEIKLSYGSITLLKNGIEFLQPVPPIGYIALGTVARTSEKIITQLGCVHASLLAKARLGKWGIMTYHRKRDLGLSTKTPLWTPEQFLHSSCAPSFFINVATDDACLCFLGSTFCKVTDSSE